MKYGDGEHKTLIGMAGGFAIRQGCRICRRHHFVYHSIMGGSKTFKKMNSNNLRRHLQSAHDVLLADHNHAPRRWWQFWRW